MEKEVLQKLIKEKLSAYKIAEKLNCSQSNVLYYIRKFDLRNEYIQYAEYKKKGGFIPKIKKEDLENIVINSNTLSECLEKMNLVPRGHNFRTLKSYLEKYEINTFHFNPNLRRSQSRIEFTKIKNPIENILVKNSKVGSSKLKERLYKENILNRVCSICGQDENWKGIKISLILDHIDGDHTNNELINLRIVCPNCNAGLPTFCRGKIKMVFVT